MSSVELKVQGKQEVQLALVQAFAAVQPDGALGKAVKAATSSVFAGVYGRTHEDTGTLRAAVRLSMEGTMGRVYNASLKNPRSGARTSVYGPIREALDGMYRDTFTEDGASIAADALRMVEEELP